MQVKITDDFSLEAVALHVCNGIRDNGNKYIALEVTPVASCVSKNRDGPEYTDEVLTCLYDEERFTYAEALADARWRATLAVMDGCVDLRDLAVFGHEMLMQKKTWPGKLELCMDEMRDRVI